MTKPTKTQRAMSDRPTLKTVATASGLAVTTVSRALGDAPDISQSTKERVRRIAQEVGYVPNRAGVRLRTGRTNVIALVLPTDYEVLNMTPRLIASIAAEMYGTGFHMVVVPELPHQDPMDPVRYVVETRSADAIILNRITPDDPRVSYLLEKGFPFATHGRAKISDRHPYFDYDNATFAALAVRLMGDRSRRNCLLIAPPQDQSYAYDLVRGARDTGRDIGIALTVADITSDDPVDEIARHVEIAFERDPSLDSVIAASPHAAIAAVGVVGRAGHTIGKTMDICAKETIGILEMLKDSVLTIHEDIDRAGSFLARAAIASVKRPQDPPMQALDKPLSPTPRR